MSEKIEKLELGKIKPWTKFSENFVACFELKKHFLSHVSLSQNISELQACLQYATKILIQGWCHN